MANQQLPPLQGEHLSLLRPERPSVFPPVHPAIQRRPPDEEMANRRRQGYPEYFEIRRIGPQSYPESRQVWHPQSMSWRPVSTTSNSTARQQTKSPPTSSASAPSASKSETLTTGNTVLQWMAKLTSAPRQWKLIKILASFWGRLVGWSGGETQPRV
jgi:hypothetical protein